MFNRIYFCSAITLLFTLTITAQNTTKAGPVFSDYGKVYEVPEANFEADLSEPMKALFDISKRFKDREGPNPLIETAARYYNLHLQNGYQADQLQAVLVIHGGAVNDLLSNTHYREKFGKDNPNAPLVAALIDKGIRVVLCGQSATYYGVTLENSVPGAEMSLSAMTALIHLQNNGYRLIHFQ